MPLVRVTKINNKGVEQALGKLTEAVKEVAASLRAIEEHLTGFKRNDAAMESDDDAPEIGGHATDEEAIIVAELKENPQLQEIVRELQKDNTV